MDELASRPSANVGDALQGKVAGLQIFNTSGEPQSSVSVRLRGESSLNLSTAPLYILDGVPVSSSVFNSINPSDIENISVLKDASSTAIYGSRAANGVIFISTKKGKKGEKPSVSFRGQYGVSMLTNYNMDMMTSEQLFQFEELCVPSLKYDPAYQAEKAFVLGNGINFDWTDYLFNDAAPMVQADASIRGASEKTNYYVSMGYYSEEGTAKASSSVDRFTFRTNLDTQVTDWLKFGANVALTYSKYHTITTGWYTQSPILQAVTGLPYKSPYQIIYNEDGTISWGEPYEVYPWDNMIDLNGNLTKTYSDDIMQFCGMDTNAPWSGGFSTNFSWKGLGVNADFSWIGERWVFLNERFYTMNPQDNLFNSNFETQMLNIWTTPGQVTDIPKYGTQFYHDTARFSNASFLRLKNLSVSYAFPAEMIRKSKVLSGLKREADDPFFVWPIPTSEMQANPQMKQNPGYTNE